MVNVLFICGGNIGRSQVAEAFFNNMTNKHKASSAGTEAFVGDNPRQITISIMKDYGVDISMQKSKQFDRSILEGFDKVIVLGSIEEFPELHGINADYWNIADFPKNEKGRREEIEKVRKKVEELIKEL